MDPTPSSSRRSGVMGEVRCGEGVETTHRQGDSMELVYFTLWFMVTAATIWDMRRTQLQSQAIIRDIAASTERIETSAERIEASAERIAQMAAEVLRRTPER